MTPNILETCRRHLEAAYRERLGLSFSASLRLTETGRQPVWQWVSPENLTGAVEPNAPGALGLLLDPEIGVLYYLAPFGPATDLRRLILCARALHARLSTEPAQEAEIAPFHPRDPLGGWRVVLHWLVDACDWQAWTKQVADVRRETAFSEDISLDAVFLDGSVDIESQLTSHGFPRLLLIAREVFKKQQIGDITRWMSADELVRSSLAGFAQRFEQPEQRELAEGIVQAMDSFEGSSFRFQNAETPASRTLRSIRAQNFRNLRDLTLDFGAAKVSAEIVHGPNGTGKSALCEAISLALFGSSSRYGAFADRSREKDVAGTDRAREYLTKYVTPLTEPRNQPGIAINGGDGLQPPQLLPPAEAPQAEIAMGGTILMQETSLAFAGMSGQDLGARVLRGYSDLADHLEQHAESRLAEANSNRQDFLRSFGLSASITKLTTAYERIARREIDRSLPSIPRALVDWLERIPDGGQLAWNWREWGDEPARNGLASRLSFLDGSPSSMREEIRHWLEAFNTLALHSTEVVKDIEARVGPLVDGLDQTVERITTWGRWLERSPSQPRGPGSAQGEILAAKLSALQAEQSRVVEQGRQASRHFDHMDQVETYLKESWAREQPAKCPTCGSDHSASGGIQAVVQSLREQTAAERDELRARYALVKRQIGELQRQLADLGEAQCPVNPSEQSRLSSSLGWMIPAGKDFAQWIAVSTQRDELLALISALKQKPAMPVRIDAELEAERVTRELLSQSQIARRMFEAPNNWKPVKERLTAVLADIVNTHLPRTLAALWAELYLNLTAAPWLLPERLSIDVTSKRGEQRSTLQVGNRLARHILNQAEVHILGLAWFFSRYLTGGRFTHACLVMDDPAQEMDQTSFRELCRLWAALLRLHRVCDQPLRLVVMLGQESRALEAARATGGTLWTLGWTPEQKETIRPVRVVPEGLEPLHARMLFTNLAPAEPS